MHTFFFYLFLWGKEFFALGSAPLSPEMDDFSQGKESSSKLSASDMLCQEVYFADGTHFFLCIFGCTWANFYAFANADSLLAFGLQYM